MLFFGYEYYYFNNMAAMLDVKFNSISCLYCLFVLWRLRVATFYAAVVTFMVLSYHYWLITYGDLTSNIMATSLWFIIY